VEPVSDVCRRNILRWFGHVERKGEDDWVQRCTGLEVLGKITRGKPMKTRMTTLKDDMKRGAMSPEYTRDRGLSLKEEDPWSKTADPGYTIGAISPMVVL
jgi:hypothetical protein